MKFIKQVSGTVKIPLTAYIIKQVIQFLFLDGNDYKEQLTTCCSSSSERIRMYPAGRAGTHRDMPEYFPWILNRILCA